MKKFFKKHYLLMLVILIAAFLRLYGLKGNLPGVDLPDEVLIVVNSLRMGNNHLKPSTFLYPTLYLYITLFEYGIFFIAGKLFGLFSTAREFGFYFLDNSLPFYMIVRFTTAILGTLTVFIVYLINREQVSKRAGLLSAVFLAVSHLHVYRSHFAGADVPMVFFLTLSFYFILRTISTKDYRCLILSGVCTGLSIGTKYNAGLLIIPYIALLPLLLTKSQEKKVVIKKWLTGFIAIPAVFFITTPYALLDIKKFLTDIYEPLIRDPVRGFIGMESISSGWWYYFSDTLPNGLGMPVFVLCFFGILYSLHKRKHYDIILLLFLIPYYFLVGKSRSIYHRFLLPIFPVMVLLTGRFIDEVLESKTTIIKNCSYALIGIVLIFPAKNAFISSYTLKQKDLRLEVQEWVLNNLPAKSSIIRDKHGPGLPMGHNQLEERLKKVKESGGKGVATKYLLGKPEPNVTYYVHALSPLNLDTYQNINIKEFDYFILASTDEDRFRQAPEKYNKEIAVYDIIRKNMHLLKSFRRKKYQPGPEWLDIFKQEKP